MWGGCGVVEELISSVFCSVFNSQGSSKLILIIVTIKSI